VRGQDRRRRLADVEPERVAFGVEIGLGVEVADRADEGGSEFPRHEAGRGREETLGLEVSEPPEETVPYTVGGVASEQRRAGLRRLSARLAMDEEESVGFERVVVSLQLSMADAYLAEPR
jgi:hypothetical protein